MTILETSQTDDSRVVLDGVSWQSYEHLLKDVGDGHLRLTYDNGTLEMLLPSVRHQFLKTSLSRIVETYAYVMGIAVEGYGSTTFKHRASRKGLEPDECYYIQHASDVIGKRGDLTAAPPPDLAVEIHIMEIMNRLLLLSLSTSQHAASAAVREWIRTGTLP